MFDPLPIGIGEIGEREIRAVQEAEPVVVIFEIKAAAPSRGLLIDKTERASVVALAQAIEQRLTELKAKAVVGVFFKINLVQVSSGIPHLEVQVLLNTEVAVIDQITGPDAIDTEQLVSRLKPQFLADGARLDGNHNSGRRLAR